MKNQFACEYENVVVNSVKSGVQTEAIAEHLRACADCREAQKIALFFRTNLQNESSPPPNLPSAGLIWWKSRRREKQRHAEQINQPIFIAQIAAAAAAFGLIIWLFANGSLGFLSLDRVFDSLGQIFVPMFLGVGVLLFVCVFSVFILRRFLTEK